MYLYRSFQAEISTWLFHKVWNFVKPYDFVLIPTIYCYLNEWQVNSIGCSLQSPAGWIARHFRLFFHQYHKSLHRGGWLGVIGNHKVAGKTHTVLLSFYYDYEFNGAWNGPKSSQSVDNNITTMNVSHVSPKESGLVNCWPQYMHTKWLVITN